MDDIVAVKIAGAAEKSFRPSVVLIGSKPETLRNKIKAIPGEGAGRFAYVLLGVVADIDREQFHQFARPIFVRMLAPALWQIEIDHHRRIPRHLFSEGGEVCQGVTADSLVLQPHPITVFYLLERVGEVTMSEEGHCFDYGTRSRLQDGYPPSAETRNFV